MLWRLRNNQPMTTIRIAVCPAGTPALGSRSGAVADFRLQLVEFLTEMPGTPLMLTAHSVTAIEDFGAGAWRTRDQQCQRATCFARCPARACRSVNPGRTKAGSSSSTILTPGLAELPALMHHLGIAAGAEVY
jgi:hypothetical protein